MQVFLQRGHLPKRVLGPTSMLVGGRDAGSSSSSFAASAVEKHLGCLTPATALPSLLSFPTLFSATPKWFLYGQKIDFQLVFSFFSKHKARGQKKGCTVWITKSSGSVKAFITTRGMTWQAFPVRNIPLINTEKKNPTLTMETWSFNQP